MKTFDEVKEMELTVFIVRQMVLLEEQEYHIRAERFTNTLINKRGDSIYTFHVGDDEIAHIYSPHYVCDNRMDVEYDKVE